MTRLVINNVVQQHTASIRAQVGILSMIRGNSGYSGNTGMWQGELENGTYTVTVQHKSGSTYTHSLKNPYSTQAMDVVRC